MMNYHKSEAIVMEESIEEQVGWETSWTAEMVNSLSPSWIHDEWQDATNDCRPLASAA
jgi:hypothetical protein